jgi:prolyl-tRNA synthetase
MKLSQMFSLVSQNDSFETVEPLSYRLLLKAGYIHKISDGNYVYMPLMSKVLQNISHIIRKEMESINAQELLLYQEHCNNEFDLGIPHQEVLKAVTKKIISYSCNFPIHIYQISTKFRDQIEPYGGLIQSREFIMKDSYSFHGDSSSLDKTYKDMQKAFKNIFHCCGINFKVINENTNECTGQYYVIPSAHESIDSNSYIEIGRLLKLEVDYCRSLRITYKNTCGEEEGIAIGVYMLGVSRLAQMIVEQFHDEYGIVFPTVIAPYKAILIYDASSLLQVEIAENLATQFKDAGVEVLLDDRDIREEVKFREGKLMGIPFQILIEPGVDKVKISRRSDSFNFEVLIAEVVSKLCKLI